MPPPLLVYMEESCRSTKIKRSKAKKKPPLCKQQLNKHRKWTERGILIWVAQVLESVLMWRYAWVILLSECRAHSQQENSVWGPIITVWCFFLSLLHLFFCLWPVSHQHHPLFFSASVHFFGWTRGSRGVNNVKKKSVLKCKRRWYEVGVWLLIFSKGFQSGLLPAISTFSNVTCCLLGKNKLPLLREVLLKIVRTDPWARTYSTHTCLISGHSLEAMWRSDMCI